MPGVREDRVQELTPLVESGQYKVDAAKIAEQMIGRFAVPTVPNAEAAAWTATVRVLLNLDEFITRE